MKIAIFHNLPRGGALVYLNHLISSLGENHKVELYTFQKSGHPINQIKTFYFPLKKTNNIFQHMYQVIFELRQKSKIMAKQIDSKHYDLIIINHCFLIQSPYLLRYLKKTDKSIYLFHEPKREFYEKTSADHYSLKKIIARLIRLPIKYIDNANCRAAKTLVANSYYAQSQIKKIYQRDSFVIHPGLKRVASEVMTTSISNGGISVGQASIIKGHAQTIRQLKGTQRSLIIIGKRGEDYQFLTNLAKKVRVHVKILVHIKDKTLLRMFNKHPIFFANQTGEPFGIATLEATTHNCFVIGNNAGGTPEIVTHGLNGFVYPIKSKGLQHKYINHLYGKSMISFSKNTSINWSDSANKLIKLYNYTNAY